MVAEFYYVEFSNVTDENDRNLDGFLKKNNQHLTIFRYIYNE